MTLYSTITSLLFRIQPEPKPILNQMMGTRMTLLWIALLEAFALSTRFAGCPTGTAKAAV